VDTLQLLDLLAELLKNGENLGVVLHVFLVFGGGGGLLLRCVLNNFRHLY